MLAVSSLVLQACIPFLRCFRQSGALLFLPCSHKTAVAHMISRVFYRLPRGPRDRKISFSLERMKKTIPPRTKFSFSIEIFILGLKFSFSIENFNPRPCFSAAREGPRMKKPFSIENFIPY